MTGAEQPRTHECDDNGTFCRGCDLDTIRRDYPVQPPGPYDEMDGPNG